MSKPPKILLVMHNVPLASGFLAAKFIGLLKELDVHLLVWDDAAQIERFVKENNLETHRHKIHMGISKPMQVWANWFTILLSVVANKKVRHFLLGNDAKRGKHLKMVLKYLPVFKIKPDIIHFEFGTLATDIKELQKLTEAKTIVSFRGYDLNYIGLNNPAYYDGVWKNADALHFLGDDLRKRAIKRGYKSDKQEAIIPPAIDTAFFYSDETKTRNKKLQIISVGRLTWKKGLEYAIHAMQHLKERGIDFQYHIVGEGQHRQAVEYAIFEHGLQNDVVLHGHKSPTQIREMLHKADIFLHPAVSEGFCNAVIEAQACGLPVICTDADGLPENIENNITGFIVPKWDAKAIAEKIEWCVTNKTELERMGRKGIERVNEKFKIETQLQSFTDFYRRVYEG